MARFRLLSLLVLPILGFTACTKAPSYPIEPKISFVSLSKAAMKQSSVNADSLLLRISFTDGDGDIGLKDSDTSFNAFLIDTRDNYLAGRYKIPFIPEQGIGNGISGEISFVVYTSCCYFPDGSDPCSPSLQFPFDTLRYKVFIRDRAGHNSDTVVSAPIVLICQ